MRAAVQPLVVNVGVIGPGKVGAAFLRQMQQAAPRLLRECHLELRLRAVSDSRHMWLDCDDEALNGRVGGAQTWRPVVLDEFAAYVAGHHGSAAVLADCTASDSVADHYAGWLGAGIHVVTPNKRAASGCLDRWKAIARASDASGARLHYEGTVGAGLPVVQTLRDLIDTGDELLAVEGMLSGTLAWLFNRFDGSRPFSALVREAHALGYTEPDPRDDLSGMDVARKLVILAREAGVGLSLGDVAVESLVPRELEGLGRDDFMEALPAMDAPMAALLARARAEGGVLRHVARLDNAGASVGVQVLDGGHAFAHGQLTDNVVRFATRRYCDNALVVQGPGAGPEVTAAAVFTDLLRVAGAMGVKRCAC
ncbi:homoserine dehydrogenase [Luteibacter yeojuensis]|uniref:Homoserine dehydrogenase n=1 Tax=Luteibacter yeojuensis TaxID=345309 RepID=A0A0F3KZQ3_9GAMM|nr:homoserine dehydrogenase [Luteibacter yeojuensis]